MPQTVENSKYTVQLTQDQINTLVQPIEGRIRQCELVLTPHYTKSYLSHNGEIYVQEVHKERRAEIAFLKRLLTTLVKAPKA